MFLLTARCEKEWRRFLAVKQDEWKDGGTIQLLESFGSNRWKPDPFDGPLQPAWRYLSATRILKERSSLSQQWKGSHGPPLDSPLCGFIEDRCGQTSKIIGRWIEQHNVLKSILYNFWNKRHSSCTKSRTIYCYNHSLRHGWHYFHRLGHRLCVSFKLLN